MKTRTPATDQPEPDVPEVEAGPDPDPIEDDDDTIVPGVTEWTTLGALMESGKLGSGRRVVTRPWLMADNVWIGDQAAIRGATRWDVMRSTIGWLLESIDGTPMVRNTVAERANPRRMSNDRIRREALVESLSFGDLWTLIVWLAADEDAERTFKGQQCGRCESVFPIQVSLLDLPVRAIVPGADVEFDAEGARWGTIGSVAWAEVRPGGGEARLRFAMLKSAHVSGANPDEFTSRQAGRVLDELDRRMPGPKLAVSTPCPECKASVEVDVDVASFLDFG